MTATAVTATGGGIQRWHANTAYAQDSVVVNNLGIYIADAAVPSRSIFTATDWTLLSGGAAGGGGSTPGTPAPGEHFAAVLGKFAPTTMAISAHTAELSRVRYLALQNIVDPVLVYTTWGYPDSDAGDNITIEATVEYPVGTFTRVKWATATSKLLTPGATSQSDETTGLTIPAGAYFYIRTGTTQPSGTGYYTPVNTQSVFSESVERDGSITHAVDSGTMTPTGGQNVNCPVAVLTTGIYYKTCAMVGDSITEGLGVAYGDSFIQRACDDAGIGSVMLGTPSEQVTAAAPDYNRRRALAQLCSTAVCQYGTNDFKAGTSLASVQASTIALWRYLEGQGSLRRMFQTTVVPYTTSSDSWITTTNQTLGTGNTARINFNNWLRDGAPIDVSDNPLAVGATTGAIRMGDTGHPIYTYFDVADKVESARDSGKWKVTAGPTATTEDGIHPTDAAHLLMQTAVDTSLFV